MSKIKNKAIKNKLANLIFATRKDICIKTRINNTTFDISRMFTVEELNDFFTKKTNKLELSLAFSKQALTDELNVFTSAKSFLDYLDDNEIFIAKTRRENLLRNFDKHKEATIEFIVNKTDNQKRKLELIIKQNKMIVRNTGIHSLYLGCYFLTGTTKNEIQVNAPLLLQPVEATIERDNLIIKTMGRDKFVVNEKLLALFKKEYDWNINIIDFIKQVKQDGDLSALIKELKNIIKFTSGLDITTLPTTPFISNSEELIEKEFNVHKSFVLGIFEPTGGSLKNDLEKLVELDVDPFVNKQTYSKTKFITEEVDNKPLLSIDGKLNIYQKYAIRSALKQNTLIYGPPGTGKSEVVANIIVNTLLNRKSTLVVAEKRAALDVLMERLQGLVNFTLFIDNFKTKAEFYEKIVWISDQLDNMYFDKEDVNLSYKVKNNAINSSHDKLKKYFSDLSYLVATKDSKGTSFAQYLELSKIVNPKLLQFVRENNTLSYIEKMMMKYSIHDVDLLIHQMSEYRNFLHFNKLNPLVDEKDLKEHKLLLTKFQIQYNTINYLNTSEDDINALVNTLVQFLKTSGLDKNKKFINKLYEDPSLLINQKYCLDKLKNNFTEIYSDDLLHYFIKHHKRVSGFISKLSKSSFLTKDKLLLNFFKVSGFFKLVDKEEFVEKVDLYINFLKTFSLIPDNEEEYLLDLNNFNNLKALEQNIVLIYLYPWLKHTYVKALGDKNLTFFSNQDLLEFNPVSNINSIEYANIAKMINFENEVINNNALINLEINQLVNDYYAALDNSNRNLSDILVKQYLQILKQTLLELDDTTRNRIQEVFAIARRNSRTNIPINELITNYYSELKILFPIWISFPELIAQTLPLKEDIFDYGIFDESSQIFMEHAYPIVYRCKINIVAGDDKQLRPTSFFLNRINDSMQEYAYNDNDQVESLLDRAKVALWPEYHLRNHYRSIHRDLIQFSNDFIYDHNLHFVTKNGTPNNVFEVLNVDGACVDGINDTEASAIFELLKQNIDRYEKIIVVCFGSKQSNYIEQIIQNNSVKEQAIYAKYLNGDLVVSNLENSQGNEADLVILSVTYGKGEMNNFRNTFGPLLADGGSNRLNVAITRARTKMIVVKSFLVDEMTYNQSNPNAKVLREFINYCDSIDMLQQQHKLIRTNNSVTSLIHDDLQHIINDQMEGRKDLYVVKNYDIGSKVLDFAFLDKKTNQTRFAIMINKLQHDSDVVSLFETMDNYKFLIDRGYKVYLLDEHYWLKNRNNVAERLVNYLKTL